MASYYQTSEFRNGIKVVLDNNPYVMTYFQFVKPGKGTAFTRTKLKNLISGSVIERTFRTGETVERADIEMAPMQYMYDGDDMYYFMNLEDFSQIGIDAKVLGDDAKFLLDGLEVQVMFYNGRAVAIELPNFIETEITYCEPGVKGNTATGAVKPATVANGASINVPLFVENGEMIKVDTRDGGKYVSRVK